MTNDLRDRVARIDVRGNVNILLAMASNFNRTNETANAEFCKKVARDFASLDVNPLDWSEPLESSLQHKGENT